MNTKHLTKGIVVILLLFITSSIYAQTYREIKGWSKEINERIETFLNTTLTMNIRKVAVFDGDGTVIGQAPHYLADEALYRYADKYYKGKNDKVSKEKMAILNRMVKDGNNVGKVYVEDRAHFLAGMTPEEVNILGMKSVVVDGVLTNEIVLPIPQDDGKANVIPTFIKTRPLVVGGNSRGDMDMLNQSCGLKIVVNPDDKTVRGPEDGPMHGLTVKEYWEKEGAVIVRCNDVRDPKVRFHTSEWGIRENVINPKE